MAPGGSFAGGPVRAASRAPRAWCDHRSRPAGLPRHRRAPKFAERFRFVGMPLKNVPKGYDPQSPAAEYLKCKCWAVEEHFDDAVVADDEACRRALLDSFAAMKTFNEYLNEALEGFAMPTR
ncbi:MAG: DUF2461 family protein [Eggerthella lenta]